MAFLSRCGLKSFLHQQLFHVSLHFFWGFFYQGAVGAQGEPGPMGPKGDTVSQLTIQLELTSILPHH